ncbi:MAG: TonB-dependent receptor [Acidobacteria bacterium]|nr:MAG: TonB-dependent receptor [Acidobacteriota bacterium]PIE90758.1 MAG: TonB-dependent receptor [Acidobacteriota bacterium]
MLAVAALASSASKAADPQTEKTKQEESAKVKKKKKKEDMQEVVEEMKVVVLGSNIRREEDIGTLPVTSISVEEIKNLSVATGDELIRSIPQIGEVNFGDAAGKNGGVNDARGDVSSINLRGVGTGNTLTLLNGRRMVTHPGTQSENYVPVSTVNSNTLPVSGLRTVEILRDGAAAVYGSDAVAGVVNYQLEKDFTGTKVQTRYGASEGTPLYETPINFMTGFGFNGGKSHITMSFSYYKRNGMMASERPYSASHDLRYYPTLPEAFIGDTQLDNRSVTTPWGEFSSESMGTFHLQPADMDGSIVTALDVEGVMVGLGKTPRALRFDRGTTRSLVSDVDRYNLYTYLTHQLDNGVEFFGEALAYSATANRTREQTHNLTAQRFKIAADAAFNPFGEQISLRRYRPLDTGFRDIEVDDTSYRILAGFKGSFGDWNWESAAFYSAAETNDLARNRIRASAFQAAVNSTDPATAYNIFTGADPANPNTKDTTLNPQSVMDQFLVDVSRDSKTSLSLVDFKLDNYGAWSNWAGDIGTALGLEYRHETFEDDRDDLLDGSHPFVDQITGVTLSGSDVWGSSPTPDSKGSRDIFSAFVECILPIINTDTQYMELQLAGRYENYSDVGDAIKPKIALFYEVTKWLSFRASHSGGFRAPGLPQVTAEGVPRSNTLYDPVLDQSYGVLDVRSGTTDLETEDDVNRSYGLVFTPAKECVITLDKWSIEQDGLVAILPASSHLLYDSYLRSQGSFDPAVVRDAETNEVVQVNNNYMNLGVRNIEGIDFSVSYRLKSSWGTWSLLAHGAKMTKFDQEADSISALLLEAQAAGDPSVPADRTIRGAGDMLQQNGLPKWRTRIALNWRMKPWGAGISSQYVGKVYDTSTTAKVDGKYVPLPVGSFSTINLYADYRFNVSGFMSDSRIRLGVRNVGDVDPPLADQLAHGYFGALHSNRGRYIYLSFSKSF